MSSFIRLGRGILFGLMLLGLGPVACAEEPKDVGASLAAAPAATVLDVYKSETCGCCGAWVEHIEQAGFAAPVHHPADLNQVKAGHGIAPRYQSCHTAVSKEGYVFEGHVPARYVEQFLQNPPAGAIGLAVPGMPVGSPGMEVGDRFSPYKVLLLNADGSSAVYAQVNSPQDQ